MTTASIRYATAAVVAALVFLVAGCSSDNEDEARPKAQSDDPSAATPPAERKKSDGPLEQPVLRALDDALDKVDDEDVEDMELDKDEARGILREADDILTRIKAENREGLKRANSPPRRVVPQPVVKPPEPEAATSESL